MACSKLFEVEIWVHLGMDNLIIFWPPSLKKNPITRVHLQSLVSIHYNALVESGTCGNRRNQQVMNLHRCRCREIISQLFHYRH